MICRHLESASTPSIFPDDVFRLEIENNTFPNDVITNVTFPPLQNLRHLAIRRCSVTNITRRAFVRLGALQVLRLSYNFISDLALGSFEGLNYVREISLDGNRLFQLPEGLFRDLDLDFLDLSDNLLAQIPGDSFAGSSVRSLNLNLNMVAFVEASSFYSLGTSLRELTLNYNRCPLRLHSASISGLNLSRLHMTHSQINDTSFLVNSTLLEVDISGNVPSAEVLWSSLRLSKTEILYARILSLSSMPVDSLASLTSAKVLDFSENRLSVVRAETFSATPQLRHLNLAHNSIGRLARDFGRNLRNLESLNLSGNALRFLYDESMLGMARLEILDLSRNRLQFISESMFRLASVITRIEGNPLHCNCQLLWLRSWLRRENATSPAITCASPFTGPLVSTSDDQLHCSPPSIIPLPKMMNVTEGDDLLLSCTAVSDPLASISWSNDQDSILMSVTPSVTQDRSVTTMRAVLGLRRLSLWNGGTYVCYATTVVGNASASLTVNVLRRITASDSITSSVEEQQSLVSTTTEKLRNTMSAGTLPTSRTLLLGADSTMSQKIVIEVKESKETFHSVNSDDTTQAVDSTAPLFETTEFISTNRQNHAISVDHFKPNLSPQRSAVEPFTIHVKISRNTARETHNREPTEGFTNFRSSNRLLSISSTSVTNATTEEDSVTPGETDSITPDETWKSSTDNDLRNDSSGNKEGEAKLSPVSFPGIGIAGSIPVVGIMLGFVGLVILSGIVIFWWSKKRRRCRSYKVRPSPRRSADTLDLRSYGNEVTEVDRFESVC